MGCCDHASPHVLGGHHSAARGCPPATGRTVGARVTRWYDVADRVGEEWDRRSDERGAGGVHGAPSGQRAAALPLGRAGRDQPERRCRFLDLARASCGAVRGPERRCPGLHLRRPATRATTSCRGCEQMLARTRHPLTVCRLSPDRGSRAGGIGPGVAGRAVRRHSDARLRPAVRARRGPRAWSCCSTGRAWTSSGPATTTTGEAAHGGAPGRDPRQRPAPPVHAECLTPDCRRWPGRSDRTAPVHRPAPQPAVSRPALTPRSRARCGSTIGSRCGRRRSCASPSSITGWSSSRCASRPSARSRAARASACCAGSPPSSSRRASSRHPSGRCRRPSASGCAGRCATGQRRESRARWRQSGGTWLEPAAVRTRWRRFCLGEGDNSHFVWQWISLALLLHAPVTARAARA